VPEKALRPRWPAGYQARLRRPGNAVLSKTTHPLNIIDFTLAYIMRSACNFARDKLRVASSGLEKHSVSATAVYATQSVL